MSRNDARGAATQGASAVALYDRFRAAAAGGADAEESLAEFCRLVSPRLSRFASRILGPREQDIREALQESYRRIWQLRAEAPADERFFYWLLKVHSNVCREMVPKRRPAVPLDDVEVCSRAAGPATRVMRDDDAERVHRRVRALPEHLRVVVEARFFAELTYEEVAESLDIARATACDRMQEGLRLLAQALRGGGP